MTRSATTVPSNRAALMSLLGLDRPVLGAPMARIAGGELASAVSNAGGFGILGAAYGDPDWLVREMGLVTTDRFGIGVITWSMTQGSLTQILAYHPTAVWLSFGDPAPHIPQIHDAGSLAICQVCTVAEAVEAADARADILVVQGREAGGHGRLEVPMVDLVASVTEHVRAIPIVASGGVTTRADLDRAVAAGAAGIAIGTALYATNEALDTRRAKMALVRASGRDTVASRVYDHVRGPLWPEGYRGRSLRTRLTDAWAGNEEAMSEDLTSIRSDYDRAVATDDLAIRVVWAGTGVGGVTSISDASTVIDRFA